MQLPDNLKIIGFVVYDEDNGEGDIFWKDWFFVQADFVQAADVLSDVKGLAERKYEFIKAQKRDEK